MQGEHYRRAKTTMLVVKEHVAALQGSFVQARDFKGDCGLAASKALGRLSKDGLIERVGKGLYYVPKETLLGKSKPSPLEITMKVLEHRARPTGLTAANLLGLTTQVAAVPEYSVSGSTLPRGTKGAKLRLRSGRSGESLPPQDAALLECLRERAATSELDGEATSARLRASLLEGVNLPLGSRSAELARLLRLRDTALREPPRVRAMLGALYEWSELPESLWQPLRKSLNPLSRFDFGLLRALPNAREWQAK